MGESVPPFFHFLSTSCEPTDTLFSFCNVWTENLKVIPMTLIVSLTVLSNAALFLCAELTRGAMTEFQEKLRQQHEESMHRELEGLVQTAGPDQAAVGGPTPGGGGSLNMLHSENKYLMSSCYHALRSLCGGTGGRRPSEHAHQIQKQDVKSKVWCNHFFLFDLFFSSRSARETLMASRSSSTDSCRSKVPRWTGPRSAGRRRTR